MFRRFVLIAAAAALCVGVGVNLWPKTAVVSYSPRHPLATLVPAAPTGWTVRNTPLGSTEISTGETLKTLDLSDYFYKTYQHDGMAVRIYVAYWTPGRIDPRVVWSHQPDVCWMADGASIVARDDRRTLPADAKERSLPARFRVFEFLQGREQVVFWHLVGRQLSGFDPDNEKVGLAARLRHFRNSLRLSGFGTAPQEQLVVRISTNRTIDQVVQSALWPGIVKALNGTGLFVTFASSS